MSMSIIAKGLDSPFNATNAEYFKPDFINTVEAHRQYLINHRDTSYIQVSPVEAIKYQGDFYGLLLHKKIDVKLWYASMRTSDFASPVDNDKTLRVILVPSPTVIDDLLQRLKRKN